MRRPGLRRRSLASAGQIGRSPDAAVTLTGYAPIARMSSGVISRAHIWFDVRMSIAP